MCENNVIVYISNNCSHCDKLVAHLNQWNIKYQTKNVTEDHENMEQLQERGVFGTPATLVEDEMILGFHINKIKHVLGKTNSHQSYFSSIYECYDN